MSGVSGAAGGPGTPAGHAANRGWPDPLGPLFPQELYRLGRRGSFFLLRVGVPLLLLASLAALYPHDARTLTISDKAKAALYLFRGVMTAQFAAVWFLTPIFAAAVLTEEREKKTLDLLLTTTLTGRDIALGKLLARLAFVGGVILAGLPVFAVLQLFGGVPVEALVLGYAALLVNLWSVGGVTAAVAAASGSYRSALFGAWFLLLFGAGCPLTSPIVAADQLMFADQMAAAPAVAYFLAHLLLGTGGAVAAVNAVRPWETYRVEPEPADKPAIVPRLGATVPPAAVASPKPAGVPVDFSWDDPPGECDGLPADVVTLSLMVAAAGLGLLVGFALEEPVYPPRPGPVYMVLGWGPAALLTAVTAAAAVSREREGDTLTVLLTVPASRGEILWRKYRSAARRHLWAWGCTLLVGALVALSVWEGGYWFLGFAAQGPVMLAAATSLGIAFTVACRTTFLAQAAAVLAVLCLCVFPWWAAAVAEDRQVFWFVPLHYAILAGVAAGGWLLAREGFRK